MIRDIIAPNQEEFRDLVSAEVYRQIRSLKEQFQHKDQEIHDLKRTVRDLEGKHDDLEQHGHRDSLRVSGISELELHDNTDTAVLKVCEAMKLDPPLQPQDIVVSHRVGHKTAGKYHQIIVQFATRNVRERVFSARTDLKEVNKDKPVGSKIYVNEDLTHFRASPAQEARSYKTRGLIADTWTMYGQILIKDNFGHVKVISRHEELTKYDRLTQSTRTEMTEAGGQMNDAGTQVEGDQWKLCVGCMS